MSREEIRVDSLAEPISHFTDAVRAAVEGARVEIECVAFVPEAGL